MYVKDWMTKNPICLTEDDSVIDAFNTMKEGNFHRVPIVEKGKLIGLITETTLADYAPSKATTLSMYEVNSLLQKTKCGDIMNKNVYTITPNALIEEAAEKMLINNINCLPVVDNDTEMLVGIITQKVIFSAFIELMGYHTNGSRIVVNISEDRPGVFRDISTILASNGINISNINVYHINDISIVIKAYNPEVDMIVKLLKDNGYDVVDYSCKID